MKTRFLLLVLALTLASYVPVCGQPAPYWTQCRVTRVLDGDTYEVLLNSQKKRVRLLNVDAPETTQPYGKQATDSLKRLLFIGRLVLIHPTTTDLYGRTLAHLKLVPAGRPSFSLDSLLVVRGWAWARGASSNSAGPRAALMDAAVYAHRGLWKCYVTSQPQQMGGAVVVGNPVPPNLWRAFNRYYKAVYRGSCTW